MPKYLISANYTAQGMAGVRDAGAKSRVDAVTTMLEAMGGRLEAFYFAFGSSDAFVIVDVPDNASAAAASLAVNSSGVVTTNVTVLMTPEEIDGACKKVPAYRAPGA